jgi:putative intracellular protease/amidase
MDVILFPGGSSTRQGETLGPDNRRRIQEFVARGGGYVGICAGAYLAIQGPPQYHHIAMVAARNWSGDAWRRGIDMLEVRPIGGETSFRLFYANGPVFRPDPREGLAPYVPLAEYVSDKYCADCGTNPGEMPGTPAILAAAYGEGRILLFSPNPVLAEGDEAAHPELFVAAVRWVAARGPVDPALRFDDVFR